jgi:hypothetical protein
MIDRWMRHCEGMPTNVSADPIVSATVHRKSPFGGNGGGRNASSNW